MILKKDLDLSITRKLLNWKGYSNSRCCVPEVLPFPPKWDSCEWVNVGAQKSYSSSSNWCSHDFFLIQVDLNGGSSDKDFPVVGEAWCCPLK